MELLLNLLWLTLALVALGSCCRVSRWSGKTNRSRTFVLTGCLLALVFPVVSASDDLNALRTEMEEGNSGNPCAKKSTPNRSAILGNHDVGFATRSRVGLASLEWNSQEQISEHCSRYFQQVSVVIAGSRAPPHLESSTFGAPLARCNSLVLDPMLHSCRERMSVGLQYNPPQMSAAWYGLRSLKCEILRLSASGLTRGPPGMTQTICRRTGLLLLPPQLPRET